MVDLETAERLAHESVVAVPAERDVLVVSGADAATYLQGQISQNAESLAVSGTSRTLLLQPQGKVEAWMRMHRQADDRFLFDVETGHGAAARDRLERFKLRVDVTIELLTVPVLSLRGPGSADAAAALTAEGSTAVVLDASAAGIHGVDLLALDGTAPSPGSIEVGPPELLGVVRIQQGLPAMGSELDESTIPAAAGIVDRSVDFTKGCYVGQELVARIDSRGSNTPTSLYSLSFDGASPVEGAELLLDGAAVGTVTSVADSPQSGAIGLGYLKRSVDVPATLHVAVADGSTVQVAASALPGEAG